MTGRDCPMLSDATRAIRGLSLHHGIPPGIKMNHRIGPVKGERCASRLQADQKKGMQATLKL